METHTTAAEAETTTAMTATKRGLTNKELHISDGGVGEGRHNVYGTHFNTTQHDTCDQQTKKKSDREGRRERKEKGVRGGALQHARTAVETRRRQRQREQSKHNRGPGGEREAR